MKIFAGLFPTALEQMIWETLGSVSITHEFNELKFTIKNMTSLNSWDEVFEDVNVNSYAVGLYSLFSKNYNEKVYIIS